MRAPYLLLAMGLAAAVAAACGGGAGGVPPAQTEGAPSATGSAISNPTSPPPASASASATLPATTAVATAPAHVEMKAPVASVLGADLQALGLDPRNLPPIAKLDPKALRGVMKLLAKSLGGKCADCHTEGDFAAPTRRKKIAAKMWDEFAVKLTLGDGGPVFCDSCHQGRIVQLDRTDKKALAKWMDASFVDGLKRKDGSAEECASCHVEMEMRFLAQWGK